ncbi:MAG TPA: MBL fold metallo-hydrolase [Myxococcales bacterium]
MIVGLSEGDEVLFALGVRRLALPIPFTQAGGPINAYLIENGDGSVTLYDCGLNTPECVQALEQGFAEAGHRLEDVSRILISHGHVDHYGLAKLVRERSGAKAYLHRRDWNKAVAGRAIAPMREYFQKLGVPADTLGRIGAMHAKTESMALKLDEAEPLEPGMKFEFQRFEGEILHFPGHTPGLVCLHAPEHRLLFSDDHLLARVSPNPLLELGENGEEGEHRALVAYLDSARRLYAMSLDWVAPGHGEPFQGHRATLDGLFRFYERRQEKLEAAMVERPKTAYELVFDIFGEAGSLQLYLMLSEVVGNLEVLEEKGRIRKDLGEVPWRYRPAS